MRRGQQRLRSPPGSTLGFEQPGVIDGHRRLGGDRLDQFLMLRAEGLARGAHQDQRPQQVLLRPQRGGQHRLGPALGTGHLVAGVLRRVGNHRGGAVAHHPADNPLPHLEALDFFEGDRHAEGGFDMELGARVVQQKDGGRIEGDQRVHALEDVLEGAIEIERAAERGADLG